MTGSTERHAALVDAGWSVDAAAAVPAGPGRREAAARTEPPRAADDLDQEITAAAAPQPERGELQFQDHQRAVRALIGWLDNDRLAVDTAITDCCADPEPAAAAGMLVALLQLAAGVAGAAAGGPEAAAGQLRRALGVLTAGDLAEAGQPEEEEAT